MSSENQVEFTRENIDLYLKEVAKEYRKQAGKKMPAELVLIGGAAVLVNYGFRNMTTYIDALIQAAAAMKEAMGAGAGDIEINLDVAAVTTECTLSQFDSIMPLIFPDI